MPIKVTIGKMPTYGNPSNFVRLHLYLRGLMVWANWRGRRFYRGVAWRPIRYHA